MRSVIRPIRRVLYILIVLGVSLCTAVGAYSFDMADQTKVFAEAHAGAVVSAPPSDPALVRQAEDFFIAGAEAEQQGNNAEAQNAYLHCSQFAQEHKLQEFIVPAYHRLAVLKAKLKEYDQSEAYFKRAIPDCGENVTLLSDYAKLYINQHRYDEAETILKNIILFAPNDQQVLYNLGYVVAVQPDRQIEGLRYMKLALGEKEAYREIAKIYRTHGHESQAAFAEQRARMNSSNRSTSVHASPEDFKELQDHIRKELMRKEVMELAEEWERENAKIVKTLPPDSSVSKEVASREIGNGQVKTLPQPAETFPMMTGRPVVQPLPTQVFAQFAPPVPAGPPAPTPVPALVAAGPPIPVPTPVPASVVAGPLVPVSTPVPALVAAGSPAPVSASVPALVAVGPPAPVSASVPALVAVGPPAPVSTPVPALIAAGPSAPVPTPVPALVAAGPPAPVPTPVPALVAAGPPIPAPMPVPALVAVGPPPPVPTPVPALVAAGPPPSVPQIFAPSPSTNNLRQDVSGPKQSTSLSSPEPRPNVATEPTQSSPSLLVQGKGNSLRSETSTLGPVRLDRQTELSSTMNHKIPDINPVPTAASVAQTPQRQNGVESPREDNFSAKPPQNAAAPSTAFKLEFVSQNDVVSGPQQPDLDDKPVLAFRSQSPQSAMDRDDSQSMGQDNFHAPVDKAQRLITPEENRPSFAVRTADSGSQSMTMRPRMPAPSPDTPVRANPVSNPAPAPTVLALQKAEQRPASGVDKEDTGHIALRIEDTNKNSPKKAPVPESVPKTKLEFVHTPPKVQEEQPTHREGLAARTIAKAPSPEITLNPAPVVPVIPAPTPAPAPNPVPVQSPAPTVVAQKPIVPEVVGDNTPQTVVSDIAVSQTRPAVAWSRPVVEPLPVLPQESEIVAAVPTIPDPGIVCFDLPNQPSLVWNFPTPDRQQEQQIATLLPLPLQEPIPVFVSINEKIADDVQPTRSAQQTHLPRLADDTEVIVQSEPVLVAKRESEMRREESPAIEEIVRSAVPSITRTTPPVQQDTQVIPRDVVDKVSIAKPVRTLPTAPMPMPIPMPEPMPEIDLKQSLAKLETTPLRILAPDPPPLPKADDSVLVAKNMGPLPQDFEAKIPSTLFDSRTDMSRLLETLNVTSKVAMVEVDLMESDAGFATTSKGFVNSDAWEVLLQELVKADKAATTTSSPSKAASELTKPIVQAEEKVVVVEKVAVIVRTIEADEMEETGFARSGQYVK